LEKLMVNMLHRKKRVNDGFKIRDFDVADKEHGKPPKKYEDVELQDYWMKMIHKHKNKS